MDRFIAECGIASLDPPGDDAREAMVRKAELFLRAGGTVTWDFWVSLSVESQMAFALAGDRILACRTAMIGTANLGREGIAAVMSTVDGGDDLVRLSLTHCVARLAREMESAEPVRRG